MTTCLGCESAIEGGQDDRYHSACSMKLFGTDRPPEIKFSSGEIFSQAQKLIGKMSISGVQIKLSVRVNKPGNSLEVTAQGGTHILKPSPAHFPNLAENENLCMNLARELAVETPPHGLLPLTDGQLVYIVRRFDRDARGDKIHVEDFAQLLGKEDKYSGSLEQIGKCLMEHSVIPFIDTQKLFIRALFYFLIGNGDAHLKNFAMISLPQRGYRLSDAYDIVSSRLVMPTETDEMALNINGKKNDISMKDFEALAAYLQIGKKQYDRLIESAMGLKEDISCYASSSFQPPRMRTQFLHLFEERYGRIFKPS